MLILLRGQTALRVYTRVSDPPRYDEGERLSPLPCVTLVERCAVLLEADREVVDAVRRRGAPVADPEDRRQELLRVRARPLRDLLAVDEGECSRDIGVS